MIFVSWAFVVFFVVVAAAYYCLPFRLRNLWLLAASLFFFAFAGPIYLIQIFAVLLIVYAFSLHIENASEQKRRTLITAASVSLVVLNLFVYKYASFLNDTGIAIAGALDWNYPFAAFAIMLPVGISFRAFQLIGYLVDVNKGEKAERSFVDFALFVTFFPKMVAGPIERARNLMPQIKTDHRLDPANVSAGLQLIAWGAFKKIVVADRLAPMVNTVYSAPHEYSGVSLAFATWLYAFQLYCDFSGYTDMALGTARVLGFKLTQNFNRPYFATSIQDFWKRWHISLTSWLTDYVFNPLIKSKLFKMKFYNLMLISMFVTFVVSGLWHGAAWTYVAWGALHGFYIVVALLLQKPFNTWVVKIGLNKRPQLYRWMKIVFTFVLVCLAYVLFRAHSMADALYIFSHLHTGWGQILDGVKAVGGPYREELLLGFAGIAVVMGSELLKERLNVGATLAARPAMRWGLCYAGMASILLLGAFYNVDQNFIYFRF